MKSIEELSVRVTYKVGLGNLKVSKKVYEQLTEIAENRSDVDGTGMEFPEAIEWLRNNVKERDCCDLQYEIVDLS